MNGVAWVIWGVGVGVFLYAIILFVRAIPTGALSRQYGRTLAAFSICTAAVLTGTLLTKYSKLHLVWMLPVAFGISLVVGLRPGARESSDSKDDHGSSGRTPV